MNTSPPTARSATSLATRPLTWLYVAGSGVTLAGLGITIDAYRHDHGAASANLISRSSPGLPVSLAGSGLAALGVLVALSLLALHDAPTPASVGARWWPAPLQAVVSGSAADAPP